MNVRLPDGTMIQNVPEGTTKAQLIEKLQGKGYDVSKLIEQTPPPETPQEPGFLDALVQSQKDVAGVMAETGKGALRGASQTARMIPETLSGMVGGPFLGKYIQQQVKQALADVFRPADQALAARPNGAIEQMAGTGAEIAGAVAAGGGGAPAQVLKAALLPAVGGALGEQVGGEAGKSIGAIAGGVAPIVKDIARTGVRAATSPTVKQNVETFAEAGAGTPSVGQATQFNFLQGMESLLSKFPGGQGVFRRFAEKQQAGLAEDVKTGVTGEKAGREIEKGVSSFVERTKGTWQKLDEAMAAKVPEGSMVVPTNAQQALDKLSSPIKGAEKSTASPLDARISDIKANLQADIEANGGRISFEGLRAIRSRVGAMLDDGLVAGAKSGEMKRLYGALSKDLEAAAGELGAGKEFARQNAYYSARQERLEGVLDRVLGQTPEETFQKFLPKNPEEVTKVRAVMRSLDPEQRQIVQEAIVNRIGRAKPGKQDFSGELFSPETFLTNWANMSQGAKAQIFSDPSVRKNMDAIAKVTSNMREGASVFANPSGTAAASSPTGLLYIAAKATGAAAAAGVSLLGGGYIGAKMLTSPKVVEWLAQAPRIDPGNMAGHIARLGVIYNDTKDQALKQELAQYIKSVQ